MKRLLGFAILFVVGASAAIAGALYVAALQWVARLVHVPWYVLGGLAFALACTVAIALANAHARRALREPLPPDPRDAADTGDAS